MCSLDDGEYCTTWRETWRKARREHHCTECQSPILPGEKYIVHFSVFERETTTGKLCSACNDSRKEFADAHDGILAIPGALSAMLHDCIADGDEESETKWKPLRAAILERRKAAEARA